MEVCALVPTEPTTVNQTKETICALVPTEPATVNESFKIISQMEVCARVPTEPTTEPTTVNEPMEVYYSK